MTKTEQQKVLTPAKKTAPDKNAGFEVLVKRAEEAGRAAGIAATPTPMHIQGYAPVLDGPCGFGWINVRPGTSAFAKWLVKTGRAHRGYPTGVDVWVNDFNQSQSLVRKEAYAHAYAMVLRAAGVQATGHSRID